MIVSAISQGMLWAILGLGIFMTYRILDFPDMTTEGSFPLGGAVCVTAITHGISPVLATLLGVGAGILAGILVMSGLNSVILFVMRTPNLSLLNHSILQDTFNGLHLPDYFDTVLLGLLALSLLIGVLLFFFNTDLGQGYIATGDNETMARSLGIKTDRMKILGLTLSNGVIALSGALIAQNDGYADVNKGIGVIVIGLASIIIGEVIFHELTLAERLIAIVVGSIIYQLLILIVIKLGFDTTYLKLFSAIILAICLMIPQLKQALKLKTGFEKEV